MRRKVIRAVELAGLGKEFTALRRQTRPRAEAGQVRLAEHLLRLHGLPQKIGQILSLTELNGDSSAFTRLVETSPKLPASEALAEISRALGRPWQDCFRSLSPVGIGASLSQVHRGTLNDGRDIAVKIQYPGIAESLAVDLKALGWLTAPIGSLRGGFDLAGYRREIGEMLKQELDYHHEADMLRLVRSLLLPFEHVLVPEVIEEYSSGRILTMTWVEGIPFGGTRRWLPEERGQLAHTLLSFFFASILSARMFHADPHPGNYRFQRGPKHATVGLIDFGCVKILSPDVVSGLHALITDVIDGSLQGNAKRAIARLERLGFEPLLLAPMQHLLPTLCEILFEPFRRDRPFDMRTWRLGARVDQTPGEFRWNFRMAGPPSLIYFMRAYQGIVQYLSALDVPVNWHAAYAHAACSLLKESFVVTNTPVTVPAKSRSLRIRVARSGRTKVELTLPVGAAENLGSLIPPEVDTKLVARNIDIAQIVRSLVDNGFPPTEIFSLREGPDDFRVWLE